MREIETQDLKLISNINNIKKFQNIILWGTSSTAIWASKILKKMDVEISGYCESLPEKQFLNGKVIYTPEQLVDQYGNDKILLIITSVYIVEIMKTINLLDFDKCSWMITTYLGLGISLDANIDSSFFSEEFKEFYKDNKKLEIVRRELGGQQDTRNFDLNHLMEFYEKPNSILVFQPGKVGSQTIYNSLCNNEIPAIHLHRLKYNANLFPNCEKAYNNILKKIKENNVIKIISGVREPISRDISNFIHNLNSNRWYLYNFLYPDLNDSFKKAIENYYIDARNKKEKKDFQWLDISYNKGKYGQEFEWFTEELEGVFGINVYEFPFDKEKGYTIIQQGNIQIFLYTLEKLNSNWKALENFLGKSIKKIDTDMAKDKKYSYLYREFLNNLSLDKEYVDFYFNGNEKVNHFYTDEDIQKFYAKWEYSIKKS